jgi:hypothetical protein
MADRLSERKTGLRRALSSSLDLKGTHIRIEPEPAELEVIAHIANETAPTPFASKGFNSLVVVPNGPLASFTLWQSKADMTRLAVWMASENGEPFKVTVTTQCKFALKTIH